MRLKNLIALSLAAPTLIGGLSGQDQSLQEKYQKKLQKEFVQKISWVQSLKEAQQTAAESNKLIFGYFTRSYAP